jgi:hypothetical protein
VYKPIYEEVYNFDQNRHFYIIKKGDNWNKISYGKLEKLRNKSEEIIYLPKTLDINLEK